MIVYYREANGDFLGIDTASNAHHRGVLGRDDFDGRAAAVAGLVGSVCTTGIARAYLAANCERVAEESVPAGWLRALGY